jgi:hypothetical protein
VGTEPRIGPTRQRGAPIHLRDQSLGRERRPQWTFDPALRSCSFVGRAALGPDIVSLPAAETLLLLYKAEIEGVSLTIDDLADRTDMSTGVILRWMKHLLERELIQIEGDPALTVRTAVRISRICELALDALLTDRNA